MLRNIHFFNIKPGADEQRMLHIMDHEFAEYTKTFGCIERKTWKRLDATARPQGQRQAAQSAAYMNESLWPGEKEANAFKNAERPEEIREILEEMRNGIEFEKTVRYVDDEG